MIKVQANHSGIRQAYTKNLRIGTCKDAYEHNLDLLLHMIQDDSFFVVTYFDQFH